MDITWDSYRKAVDSQLDKIEIECRDTEGELSKLLAWISRSGNVGHSFEIIVDPENKDFNMRFFWDGDGSDHIGDITVNGNKMKF